MKHLKICLVFLTSSLFFGCSESETPESVQALKPVYGTLNDISSSIKSVDVQPIKKVGKIYTINNLLFINEVGKGVHVIDNSLKVSPKKIKFIEIPGNVDIAIKGNYMYADIGSGLATINISDINNVEMTSFDSNYVPDNLQFQPPQAMLNLFNSSKVYFECPQSDKGIIISWEVVTMPKPQCYLNN